MAKKEFIQESYQMKQMVDEKTKAIMRTFVKEEKELIDYYRDNERYQELLKTFSHNKNIKRLCQIIKFLYLDLKSGKIPLNSNNENRRADFEIAIYERSENTAKLAILLSIDSLNGLVSSLKPIYVADDDDFRKMEPTKMFNVIDTDKEEIRKSK